MTSTPSFSIKQLDIILISGSTLGIYLCGLSIGEQLQTGSSYPILLIAVCIASYLLWFLFLRIMYNIEVKK